MNINVLYMSVHVVFISFRGCASLFPPQGHRVNDTPAYKSCYYQRQVRPHSWLSKRKGRLEHFSQCEY